MKTLKNKIAAIVMLLIAWAAAKASGDLTATIFIVMVFVIPLLTAKDNIII